MLTTNLNKENKCVKCFQKIEKDSKFVLLGTYEKKTLDETYFHYACYIEWINLKIKEHSINQWNQSMKDMMPHVKQMVQESFINA